MFKYIIPGYYLFYSRLKSKLEKISWFIIYIIPIYTMGLYYMLDDYLVYSLFFSLAILIFNSIYEIGYIENDTRTIQYETKPTLRLQKEDYIIFKEQYFFIIVSKISLAILLLFLVNILANKLSYDIFIMRFIILLCMIRFFFYLHNKIRSNINILTFFILSIMKYTAPLFLILPIDNLFNIWWVTLFLFPIIRTMEHSTKEKYKLKKWYMWIGDHDLFRIKYYSIILIIFSFIYIYVSINIILMIIVFLIYFLIYRISSYLLIKNKIYKRSTKLLSSSRPKC